MLKKLDKKICLLAVAAAVLAGVLVWLAIFGQLKKIREVADDIQKEQLDSLVREQRSRKILEIEKELGNVEKSGEEMRSMLVDGENAVPFLKKIEEIAALSGNTIKINVTDLTKIKPKTAPKPAVQAQEAESKDDLKKESQAQKKAGPQESKPDYSNQLGFSIELAGRYGSLVDFLARLENLPYFTRIYNFQMTPSAKNQTVQVPSPQGQTAQAAKEDKNIKSVITIGVYTNGSK